MLGPFLTASSERFSLSPIHGRAWFWLISATEIGDGGRASEWDLSLWLWMTMSLAV